MSTIEQPSTTARGTLTRVRGTVDPALREAVGALPESMQRLVGYHFGWCDADGAPENSSGGKAIRPALTLLAAEAVGGSAASATPAAVGVELVHNFSLLHDDVMDGDVTRRHRPTTWSVFGSGPAILAGDALLTASAGVLAASGHPAASEGVRTLNDTVLRLIDGQSSDMAFERRSDVELNECLSMAGNKTGALLGCACAVGALFGGADARRVDRLRRFGEQLGLAFQHVDDLLGIWGDPEVTGKPVHADLHTRKKSLPVVAALTSGTPAGAELAALYHAEEPLSAADVVRAAELVEAAGGRSYSQRQADDLLTEAAAQLRAAEPAEPAAAELHALARLATRRES